MNRGEGKKKQRRFWLRHLCSVSSTLTGNIFRHRRGSSPKMSGSRMTQNVTRTVFCVPGRSGVTWPRRRGTTAPKSMRTLPSASWGEESFASQGFDSLWQCSATSWLDVTLRSHTTKYCTCIGYWRRKRAVIFLVESWERPCVHLFIIAYLCNKNIK